MKNIKNFNQYVNENYTNEGFLSSLKSSAKKATDFISGKINTPEEWWNARQSAGNHLTNSQYVEQLIDKGIAKDMSDDIKRMIDREASRDKFEGEVRWNRNKREWYYLPGENIRLGSHHGGFK